MEVANPVMKKNLLRLWALRMGDHAVFLHGQQQGGGRLPCFRRFQFGKIYNVSNAISTPMNVLTR